MDTQWHVLSRLATSGCKQLLPRSNSSRARRFQLVTSNDEAERRGKVPSSTRCLELMDPAYLKRVVGLANPERARLRSSTSALSCILRAPNSQVLRGSSDLGWDQAVCICEV